MSYLDMKALNSKDILLISKQKIVDRCTCTCTYFVISIKAIEPVHDKTNNLGFRPGPTQTSLYSHRRNPES